MERKAGQTGRSRRKLVLGLGAILLLFIPLSCGDTTPIQFSVQRLAVEVFTGAASGGMAPMADAGPESLPQGHWVSTDVGGQALLEGLLSSNKTCRIYVFQLSSLLAKACPRSSYEGSNTATCQEENTAVYKECRGNLQMTPTGEVEVVGSWLSLTYLPKLQLTLVIVAEGQARVYPVLKYGSPELGNPINVNAQQFLYTAPDDMVREIAGLPPRESLPLEDLPALAEALGIEPWIERVIYRAEQDGVPLVVTPEPELGLFVVRGAGGALDDARVQGAVATAVNWKAIIAEVLGADHPVARLEFPGRVTTTDQVPFDRDKSMALLAEADYPQGFPMLVLVSEQAGELINVAEWMFKDLTEVGMTPKFRAEPPEEMAALIKEFEEADVALLWLAWE